MESMKLDDAGWSQHIVDYNNVTYFTNIDKTCYTCVTVPCWFNRKIEYRSQFPAKKLVEKGKGRSWRTELDKETSAMCKDYEKIMTTDEERQVKQCS